MGLCCSVVNQFTRQRVLVIRFSPVAPVGVRVVGRATQKGSENCSVLDIISHRVISHIFISHGTFRRTITRFSLLHATTRKRSVFG